MIKIKYDENSTMIRYNRTSLNETDYQYHKLLNDILKGWKKQNRTGVETLSIFGPQIRFKNVQDRFPILTTKKIHLKSVIGELLWFLSGSTNANELREKYNTTIWDEWANPDTGELGPVYGFQWRKWQGWLIDEKTGKAGSLYFDQISQIVHQLKTNPDDRRIIVSAWNVAEIDKMALPPCHYSFQLWTRELTIVEREKLARELIPDFGEMVRTNEFVGYNGYIPDSIPKRALSLLWNQRSCDTFLGIPFNIASYAILLLMLAQQTNMYADELIGNLGDAHLYVNHLEYVNEQLNRDSKGPISKMILNNKDSIFTYTPEDFKLINYDPHPNWKNVPIAV